MAHNHRMRPIADPYLNELRNRQRDDEARMRHLAGNGWTPEELRSYFNMPGVGGGSALEGKSDIAPKFRELGEDYGDLVVPLTTDADLMPDTDAPIDVTKRAFGESGHGFSIREGKKGQ